MTIRDIQSYNSLTLSNYIPQTGIDDWVAFDLEWTTKKIDNPPKYNLVKNSSATSEPPVFSYDAEEFNEIVTFAFEDSNGNRGVMDITEFESTRSFLQIIRQKLLQYQYCFAWGSKAVARKNEKTGELEGINGDLVVLDSNFKANKIPSIVLYNEYSKVPYLKKDIFTLLDSNLKADIDLLKVFAKPLLRISIFKNKYKSLQLGEVSQALLGKGKLDDKSGAKLDQMSINKRKMYCLHDAHLVSELVGINGGQVLRIMQTVASHTGLTFEEVCHKGMTGLWKKIINEAISKKIKIVGYCSLPSVIRKLYSNNINYTRYADYFDDDQDEEDDEPLDYNENSHNKYGLVDQEYRNRTEIANDHSDIADIVTDIKSEEKTVIHNKYKGGLVFDPIRGLYQEVYLFDITSLYPTMIINNNISPETVNCSCCKNNSNARLVFDKPLLDDLKHGNVVENNKVTYWTCKRKIGLFSTILEELTQKRIQYKTQGMDLESTAIKAVINSGYGVFGHHNFKYYDPKVAEVITALGRQTLLDMKKIAKEEMGFNILYGDTDSLFVNKIKDKEDIHRFINHCKVRLNVTVNHDKTFRKLILVSKKHYIGIPYGDDKPVIKAMEGIKSDRPEFIQTVFREMVKDIQEGVSPIPKLKQALADLDKRVVPKERLSISLVLTKNPEDYTHDDKQKRLGTKLKLKKGDTLDYYKCNTQIVILDQNGKQRTRTVGESVDPNDISYVKYKEMLINTVKDVIEILGYSVEKDLLAKRKLT